MPSYENGTTIASPSAPDAIDHNLLPQWNRKLEDSNVFRSAVGWPTMQECAIDKCVVPGTAAKHAAFFAHRSEHRK